MVRWPTSPRVNSLKNGDDDLFAEVALAEIG
jgi:hypothetical protein